MYIAYIHTYIINVHNCIDLIVFKIVIIITLFSLRIKYLFLFVRNKGAFYTILICE